MEALDIILPIVYIIVGCALVWFVIELAITIRKLRSKTVETIDNLEPSIKNIETMVGDIQPVVKKLDPLMDRVTLTVDSVNLEILRVDEILEDVTQMTGAVSKTLETVDNVTSAPVDLVTSMTKKVREKFRPKFASDESVRAGLQGAPEQKTNPIVDFADTAVDAAGEAFREQHDKKEARKAAQDERSAEKDAKTGKLDETSGRIVDKVMDNVDIDAAISHDATTAAEEFAADTATAGDAEVAAEAFETAGNSKPETTTDYSEPAASSDADAPADATMEANFYTPADVTMEVDFGDSPVDIQDEPSLVEGIIAEQEIAEAQDVAAAVQGADEPYVIEVDKPNIATPEEIAEALADYDDRH